MYRSRGFTLFELIIVITIVGIIISIVFSILSDSRNKGMEGAIEQNLVNARSQAEVYFHLNDFSHVGVCDNASSEDPPGIRNFIEALDEIEIRRTGDVKCVDPPRGATEGWAVDVQLVRDPTKWYCIDYTGAAEVYSCSTIGGINNQSDPFCGPEIDCPVLPSP